MMDSPWLEPMPREQSTQCPVIAQIDVGVATTDLVESSLADSQLANSTVPGSVPKEAIVLTDKTTVVESAGLAEEMQGNPSTLPLVESQEKKDLKADLPFVMDNSKGPFICSFAEKLQYYA